MSIDPNTMHVGTLVLHVVQCKMEGPILTSFCHVLAEQPQCLGTRFVEVFFSNEHLKQQQANIMPWSLIKINSWHLLHFGLSKLVLCSVNSAIEIIEPAKNTTYAINESDIENMLFQKQQQQQAYRSFVLHKTNSPLLNNNNNNMICDDENSDQIDIDESAPDIRKHSLAISTLSQIRPYQDVVSVRARVCQVVQPVVSERPSTDAQAAQFISPQTVWSKQNETLPMAYRSHLLTRLQNNKVYSQPGAIVLGQIDTEKNSESPSIVGEITVTNSELCFQVKEGVEMDIASLNVVQRMNVGSEYAKCETLQPFTGWLQFQSTS